MKKNLDVVLDKLKLKDGEIRLLYEVISGTFQCVGFVPLLSQDFKSFSNPQAKFYLAKFNFHGQNTPIRR